MRPRVFDKMTKSYLLVDSGSAVTVVAAGPDDVVQPGMYLQAVNGQRVDCCGKRKIAVQLGRKRFEFEAVVAKIKSTIIGWDFICHFKLNWEWDQWGNIHLVDKKADIKALMQHITVPHMSLPQFSSLEVFENPVWKPPIDFLYEVFTISDLEEEVVENIKIKPEYQALIDKHPDILKSNFKEAKAKHNIIHRIDTGSAEACHAKVRPLVPGSPKAKGGEKAWKELISLGIVERVDPNQAHPWTSGLHLAPKKDGSQRPTGDYRALNAKTVTDRYPLPALKTFNQSIKESKIFSRVDLQKAYHQIPIHKDDRHKTAVVTPWGTYQFRRLAMGLSNSGQCFQKLLDSVLEGMNIFFAI